MKKDDKFVLTPEIYSEVLEYYGYKMENGKFIKKPKIPEFEYFGKWKNSGFHLNKKKYLYIKHNIV